MSSSSNLLLLVAGVLLVGVAEGRRQSEVTCGSVLKLTNNAFKMRLHSHDVKYGSGSGQQSVTGTDEKEDVNSNWVVKGTHKSPCHRGEAIECGRKIRLEHLQTGKNLHSHLFQSPLSGNQEISAFGDGGEGDSGDNWEVLCHGSTWDRDEAVQFRHLDTNAYLSVSGSTFGRPIHGQMEIVGLSHSDSSSYWTTAEGIFMHRSDPPSSKPDHTEL